MNAAEKLLRLEAEATPGPWHVRKSPMNDYDLFVAAPPSPVGQPFDTEVLGDENYPTKFGDARLIVALRSLAKPLADWMQSETAFNAVRAGDAGNNWGDRLERLNHSSAALLAAVEAAMKEQP